ncbi:MAG: hypothetical protein AB7G12_06850 [Thermoanaerobaculia bacterium]
MRSLKLHSFFLILASLGVPGTVAHAAVGAGEFALTVSGRQIVASGLTSGGQLILLGVQREPIPGSARVGTWVEALTDDDLDGSVIFDLERPAARKSAWAAMDLATGTTATAVGPGFHPDVERPGAEAFEIDPVSGEVLLRLEREILQIIAVRPTAGAWALRAYEGARGDIDGANDGILRFSLGALEPLLPEFGEYPGLSPSDLIVAIDERTLTIFLVRGSNAPEAAR